MTPALIPQPHRVTRARGFFRIPDAGTIGISDRRLYQVAEEAGPIFRRFKISITQSGISDSISIILRNGLKPGGYRLKIQAKRILLEAESVPAAFHGVQTLLQIASQGPEDRLPIISIDDWPDFRDRGVYYDVSRGRVPRLERLMQQADLLSQYKINQLQLYVEHTFRFRGHPDIGRNASPLTAEDILELDLYCRERHVELVPSLASFGHMSNVLKHPQYHQLAEDWGIGKYQVSDEIPLHMPSRSWTLSPANPKTYKFLDSLFAEFLPLFSSDRFNICCDETRDLGLGQSYELCRKEGRGRVYLDHIIKLRDLAARYGKKIMFWGDIIRKYPELIKDIPDDVTVLDWGYDHDHNYAAISDFRKAKRDFFACPGTGSWIAMFPRLPEARINIHGFASAGKKNGALGLLNTDWGDGGHYNFMEFSWPSYLFGAEQAWNVRADTKSFTKRFCRLFLKSDSADLPAALDILGDIAQMQVQKNSSIWEKLFFAAAEDEIFQDGIRDGWTARSGKIRKTRIRLNASLGRETIRKLNKVRRVFVDNAKRDTDPYAVLPYWIFAVDTIAHAAAKLTVLGAGGRDTSEARRRLKKEMAGLMKRFRELWLQRNRPSEIRITLKRYRKCLRSL